MTSEGWLALLGGMALGAAVVLVALGVGAWALVLIGAAVGFLVGAILALLWIAFALERGWCS